MEIKKTIKGNTKRGLPIHGFILENEFLRVELLELGATITALVVKGLSEERDIVLGYDTVHDYEMDTTSMGATVGRFANRIANGQVRWNKEILQLEKNNGQNHLHGGSRGAKHLVWNGKIIENGVVFSTIMKSEDDGYPGDLAVDVIYTLEKNKLEISFHYESTEDSFVNFTNHTYFNLKGSGTIYKHSLQLQAPYYTPFDSNQIPTGVIESVVGTPLNFTIPRMLGEALRLYDHDLAPYKGYDHNLLMHKDLHYGRLELFANIKVCDIALSVYSDAPAFQLYTGNWLDGEVGKKGEVYEQHSGICIEPQFVPNDINMETFEESFVEKGITYHRRIVYVVDLIK